jgi:hypothetical protein
LAGLAVSLREIAVKVAQLEVAHDRPPAGMPGPAAEESEAALPMLSAQEARMRFYHGISDSIVHWREEAASQLQANANDPKSVLHARMEGLLYSVLGHLDGIYDNPGMKLTTVVSDEDNQFHAKEYGGAWPMDLETDTVSLCREFPWDRVRRPTVFGS